MKPSPLANLYFASGFIMLIVSGILTMIFQNPVLFAVGIGSLALFYVFGLATDVYRKEEKTQ
jgi:hypothetical protein